LGSAPARRRRADFRGDRICGVAAAATAAYVASFSADACAAIVQKLWVSGG
jgi:hypothetical protein